MSPSRIRRAASSSVVSGGTVAGSGVMTSETRRRSVTLPLPLPSWIFPDVFSRSLVVICWAMSESRLARTAYPAANAMEVLRNPIGTYPSDRAMRWFEHGTATVPIPVASRHPGVANAGASVRAPASVG